MSRMRRRTGTDVATVPERWARARPDSRVLERPRLLARRLMPLSRLDHAIAFYEQLQATPADLRMPIPDFGGLELAAVGDVLLIASERPFTAVQLRTRYSLIVGDLNDSIAHAVSLGAEVTEARESIVPGARARLCLPDGHLIELVEHRPLPAEPAGAPLPMTTAAARRDALPAAARPAAFAQTLVDDAHLDHTCALYSALLQRVCVQHTVRGEYGQVRVATVGTVLIAARAPGQVTADEVPIAVLTSAADAIRRFASGWDSEISAPQSTAVWERDDRDGAAAVTP